MKSIIISVLFLSFTTIAGVVNVNANLPKEKTITVEDKSKFISIVDSLKEANNKAILDIKIEASNNNYIAKEKLEQIQNLKSQNKYLKQDLETVRNRNRVLQKELDHEFPVIYNIKQTK